MTIKKRRIQLLEKDQGDDALILIVADKCADDGWSRALVGPVNDLRPLDRKNRESADDFEARCSAIADESRSAA